MKKLVSLMLAVIMAIGISVPAFAEGAETVDVDNTFDNFTPGPGKQAPDNWYDPYCYEEDGRINPYCLNKGDYLSGGAYYCPEYKRIFTITSMGRKTVAAHFEDVQNDDGTTTTYYYPERVVRYRPYEVYLGTWTIIYEAKSNNPDIVTYDNYKGWYCPYCGMYSYENYTGQENYTSLSAFYTHERVFPVVYGYWHDVCNTFIASENLSDNVAVGDNPFSFMKDYVDYTGCYEETDINTMKLYRFLSEEQRNADYSFIFTETEKDFGDGKDGRLEDLKKDGNGMYNEWDSEDNPYYEKKLTFWEKIAAFFNNIAKFFNSIFNAIAGIFK